MAYTSPTVNYCATVNGTYTTLTGIQSVSIVRGRDYYQDNFKASSCVIELIPATSYALPIAIGQFIDVRDANTATSRAYFAGKITDVRRDYAIPYNSGTGYAPGDRITITATGGTGLMAQNTLFGGTAFAYTDCAFQTYEVAAAAGVVWTYNVSNSVTSSLTTMPAQSALDICNQLARTGQFNIDDGDQNRNAANAQFFVFNKQSITKTFTDTGAGIKYNGLAFQSSAQSTFNKINVIPVGLTAQVSQAASGPYNSLDYNTYNKTTGDALTLANYLYALFNTATQVAPYQLTTTTAVDASCLDVATVASPAGEYTWIGAGVTINFRGTSYLAAIQQVQTTFYPDYAQVQLTLSPSLGVPFTLDSATFGILDSNRLGYP